MAAHHEHPHVHGHLHNAAASTDMASAHAAAASGAPYSPTSPTGLASSSSSAAPLQDATDKIVHSFEFTARDLDRALAEFLREADEGLATDVPTGNLSQIPTFVTSVPDGSETVSIWEEEEEDEEKEEAEAGYSSLRTRSWGRVGQKGVLAVAILPWLRPVYIPVVPC